MFKFLRKYSVWILGVGGTLLLIAFLAPNVIQQLAQQAGYAGTRQATVGDGESVGFAEWQQIIMESQVIDIAYGSIPGVGELASPAHWFLLSREADLAGFTPSSIGLPIEQQTVFGLARRASTSPAVVLDALAHFEGVQRLLRMYQTASRFSDRRLNFAANDLLTSAAVETVVIPATPQDNGSFSDEDLQAQFEAWAETDAGEGDHGFGYKLPDRFKVEWLTIPAESILSAAKNSDGFSTKAQRKYWRRNENDPRFPAIEVGADIPEEVVDAFLKDLSDQTRSTMSRNISEQLRSPRRGLNAQGGFLQLPEDWDDLKLDFETLATNIQDEFSISIPKYGSLATLIPVSEANTVDNIGNIFVMNLGDNPLNFSAIIRAAMEFGGDGLLPIQQGVASPVLESITGDLVVIRITEAAPSNRPESIEEVQDQVEYDLGQIARWKTLLAEVDMIEQHAREKGLLAVAVKHEVAVNRPQSVSLVETGVPTISDPASRRQQIADALIQRISFGQQIDDMASVIRGLERPDQSVIEIIKERTANLPIETPISSLDIEERIFIVPSDENMALVLVRVTGTSPVSRELAKDLSGGSSAVLQTLLAYDELGGSENIINTFSFDALTTRHNFNRGRVADDEDVETSVN